jgi:hypothetical protein
MDLAGILKAALLAALVLPVSAAAQSAAPNCAAPVAPTGVLAPWTSPVAATAAESSSAARTAPLAVGEAARVTLLPTSQVSFAAPPERPGDAASFGGVFTLAVAEPGTYRVALGAGAWIDLVRGGEVIASTAHSHGPECSGIRKMVDFPLEAGTHIVQIAASPVAETTVLVARLP